MEFHFTDLFQGRHLKQIPSVTQVNEFALNRSFN